MSVSVYWAGSTLPDRVELIRDDENEPVRRLMTSSIKRDKPFVLQGKTGVGKTTIIAEVFRELQDADLKAGVYTPHKSFLTRHTWLDKPNWWTVADDYCRDVKFGYTHTYDEPRHNYSAEGIAAQVKRLFLDDVGNEPHTDANKEAIAELLMRRYEKRLPTWITTNMTADEFSKHYGERVASRLRETSLSWFVMEGQNRRVEIAHEFTVHQAPRREQSVRNGVHK